MTTLIQHIADASVMPLQLFNFGTVVDNIGPCGNAWSTAIMSGNPASPRPRDGPDAVRHRHSLRRTPRRLQLRTRAVLPLRYSDPSSRSSCSTSPTATPMVACAAFINAIMLLFAAPMAMIAGELRQRLLHRLTQFFRHIVLVFAYVLYISFAAVIVLKMAASAATRPKWG